MFSKLSNGEIEICVNSKGAELSNLSKTGESYEYMWQGDEAFWTGRSPVLFPIIGAVKNGEYRYDGATYQMPNHGLARKSEFELIESSKNQLIYSLKYSDEFLKIYPFEFELQLVYTLEGMGVNIEYRVMNHGSKVMPFQLGTHPAFNCPMDGETVLDDYVIEFNKEENAPRLYLDDQNLIDHTIEGDGINGKTLKINKELFYNNALVYQDVNSDCVSLKSPKTNRQVTVESLNMPHLGLWQTPNAPFVCIEPWHGMADWSDFDGDIDEKEEIVKLGKDEIFTCSIKISVK